MFPPFTPPEMLWVAAPRSDLQKRWVIVSLASKVFIQKHKKTLFQKTMNQHLIPIPWSD